MSDPAVEAARRAEQASGWWKSGYSTPWDHDYAVDSIREALRPIRELHYPVSVRGERVCGQCSNMATQIDWPCRTARLVYASEELGAGDE